MTVAGWADHENEGLVPLDHADDAVLGSNLAASGSRTNSELAG